MSYLRCLILKPTLSLQNCQPLKKKTFCRVVYYEALYEAYGRLRTTEMRPFSYTCAVHVHTDRLFIVVLHAYCDSHMTKKKSDFKGRSRDQK